MNVQRLTFSGLLLEAYYAAPVITVGQKGLGGGESGPLVFAAPPSKLEDDEIELHPGTKKMRCPQVGTFVT